MIRKFTLYLSTITILTLVIVSCGKDKSTPTPPPVNTDPCAGVTIAVQATKQDATPGTANGSITITSPLGAGFTYGVNGGALSTTTTYNGLAVGSYTITARNANGCTGSLVINIAADACAGKNITVSAPTIVNNTPCVTATGSITASATGSTGFTYNINNGTFQASGTFTGLAAGNYTIAARDVDGCVRTGTFTVANVPAGPLFTAVRGVIQNNCVSCHGASNPSGGVSLNTDCSIVDRWDRIKARAVDGVPSWMPQSGPMPISERNKITAWVNAGHRYTD